MRLAAPVNALDFNLPQWTKWADVGIATGILIAVLHRSGLATLRHTPSPMKFLSQILGRPDYERPLLLLLVGYPPGKACVPDIATII